MSVGKSLYIFQKKHNDAIMESVADNDWHGDVTANLFGCVSKPAELIYLLLSNVLYQKGFMNKGRINIFFIAYSKSFSVRAH